ncbi:MAG: ABC transporter permease [Polyangiaceae bacterium]|nr:ABC transporter permease [Polyangiaceae bacterium]
MTTYILRRMLLMIPTFVGISIIVFVVLNLAPGRPGMTQQGDTASTLRGQTTQESYRIFREQFHLDKPTLLNSYFTLSESDIETRLRVFAELETAAVSARIRAQEELEDYGSYAVPHLMAVLRRAESTNQKKLRDVAVYFLSVAAQRPLLDPYNSAPPPEVAAYNRAVDLENSKLRVLRYPLDAEESKKLEVVRAWNAWFKENQARFSYTFGEKVKIFFTDTRFAKYWSNLARLDFGISLVSKEPVLETLVRKLRYSLGLSVGSLLLAYLIAIPLGVFSAVKRDSTADRTLTVGLFMLYSLPSFFVATLLLYFLSQGSPFESWRLFPTGGWESQNVATLTWYEQWLDVAWHLVLPMFCMTYGSLAALSRYMRSGLLEVIQSDYIRTARAKGLPESSVIGKHAMRNGLLPILTLLAGLLPAVLGGSVIIEYIFGIPGMGLWAVDAIYQRDYNVIMAIELLSTVLVLVGILLTDLSYALVDPRIRYS